MARNHPGVWSVLQCFIGPTKKEMLLSCADTKAHPELLYKGAGPTRRLDREAQKAVFIDSHDRNNKNNESVPMGPFCPIRVEGGK